MMNWELKLICCGLDDGIMYFSTEEQVEEFREYYTSGAGVNEHGYSAHPAENGHKRAAIKSFKEA